MIKRSRILPAFALIALVALAGCRTAPIYNVEGAPLANATGEAYRLNDVTKAIIKAGARRGWDMQVVTPGQIEGKVNVRGKHSATVDIFYDADSVSIRHKSSRNLNYNATRSVIHPNYNSWIRLLEGDIRKEIQVNGLS